MSAPANQPVSNAPHDSGAKDPVVPVWLVVVCFLLFYWGAVYFDEHGGWFDTQVYTPYVSAEDLQKYQVAGGPDPMVLGAQVYGRTCAACHQPSAMGTPGSVPPLVGSDWVNEKEPGRIIRFVLHGFAGPGLVVNGKPFETANQMTAFGEAPPPTGLTDEEIAAVITYVRGNEDWHNHASPVTEEQVKAIRNKYATRKNQPFSPTEIKGIDPAQ